MSLIVVGVNHRSVPVDVLERMAVAPSGLPKALHDLAGREHIVEVVLLSTCNRTEIYARCTRFHAAVGDVRDFLAEHSGLPADDVTGHLYTYFDDAAVAHLFSVASGLDSMIVGESEILGQVRDSWLASEQEGTSAHLLGTVFRRAVESGKRVRTETEIARHPVSIASAAVAVASEHLGGLEGCRVLVVGAGEMGDRMANALMNRGVEEICVTNRTHDRALDLADRLGGRAVGLDSIDAELAGVDLVLASTGSRETLVERSVVEAAMAQRPDRQLLIVDIALPRDFDPGVGQIDGVTLLDLDDLKDFAQRSADRRRSEIGTARRIINEEIERYREERAAREVAPLVVALRANADDLRRRELERHSARLASLDPETRAMIESITEGIVNKILHEPTVRLKAAARSEAGDVYAEVLAALFDLGDVADLAPPAHD